jgi:hypothetical protein
MLLALSFLERALMGIDVTNMVCSELKKVAARMFSANTPAST